MHQVNYNGLRKRESYDEIVNIIEDPKDKIKYPDRRATFTLQSPQVSSILHGSTLEIDQQQENFNKQKLIEQVIHNMSTSTNTHNVHNHYTYQQPKEPTNVTPVDVNMDDNVQREKI